jgi:glycosyltransferase involved in cell wall biosynthesis
MILFRREVKNARPALVLSFGEYWNSFVLLSLAGTGYPVFISDRCAPSKPLGGFQEVLRRVLYRGAAGIIVQTRVAEEIYRRRFPRQRIAVIGNPVRITPGRDTGSNGREKVILMVARMIASKHHDRLLHVFARLEAPGWKLLLVGGDALKQHHLHRLKGLARELQISDRVEFAGECREVEPYYRSASVFAFTSSSEGFPNVIAEALAAGLPVVSYDCEAGPSELIRDGENGFLVPLFDDTLFRERLQQLVDDEELRRTMGTTAAEGMARYESSVVARRYLAFMEEGIHVPVSKPIPA